MAGPRLADGAIAVRLLVAALALVAAFPAAAQTSQEVHAAERARFGYGKLRQGANGNNPAAPNAANYDEAKVGNLPLPSLGIPQSAEAWPARRTELVQLVEDNWVGRVPQAAESFRVVWNKEEARSGVEQWVGQILAPDGRMGPTIDATITFPSRPAAVPALIDYTYIWPPNFNLAALNAGSGGQRPPSSVDTALAHGFAHVAYRPQMLQADNAAEMDRGVIGLARWPREEHDWGALRAWAWGASRLREELARDPRINGERISLTGHSRFGKSVLVAAAFDHAFADAQVSSSGAGGAKIMRRDMGERWENMASSGAFHWFTPAIMQYAQQGRSVAELPIDAHTLIALRAPRPLFVTSGMADKGDAWVDPRGMWLAVRAAQPAWEQFGAPGAQGAMPAAGLAADATYALGWYQHGQGHVAWPAFEELYRHEAKFAAGK